MSAKTRLIVQSSHMKVDVKGLPPAERARVITLMTTTFSAQNTDLKNTKMGRSNLIALNVCAWDVETGFMLSGFLPFVKALFARENVEYELIDNRKWPKIDVDFVKRLMAGEVSYDGIGPEAGKTFKPRDYQIDAVVSVVRNSTRKSGGGHSICNVPTGVGKSFIIALLVRCFPTARVLLPFDRVDLVFQTKKDLVNKYGFSPDDFGIVQGAHVQEDRRVTLLSIQSFEKATSIFPFVGVIIQDEVHDAGSGYADETANKIYYSCQNAAVRIGLSATSDVIDNPYKQLTLHGNFGPIVFKETMKDKVEEGVLAEIDIRIYDVNCPAIPVLGSWADVYKRDEIKAEDVKKYPRDRVEWDAEKGVYLLRTMIARGDESTHYVFNDHRNDVIARLAMASSRCVVLLTRKEHTMEVAKRFDAAGFADYMVVDGGKDEETREAAKKFLLSGTRRVVLASSVWNKGVDIPWMEHLIIGGSGVSTTNTIQKLGRNARKCTDTEKFVGVVYDFNDAFSRLGVKQSAKRAHVYQKELGFEVKYMGEYMS